MEIWTRLAGDFARLQGPDKIAGNIFLVSRLAYDSDLWVASAKGELLLFSACDEIGLI